MPRGGIKKGGVTDPYVNLQPGDNSKYLLTALAVKDIGKTKCDLDSVEEVTDRIRQYFTLMADRDQKPTMTGLAMAMGYDRRRLYEIYHNLPVGGNKGRGAAYGYTKSPCKEEVRSIICQALDIMTSLWEDYMQNGKINPASGIFLGKNFYGMKDEVEHVVSTPDNPIDNYSAADIAERYGVKDKTLAEKNEKVYIQVKPEDETPE